LGVVVPVGGTQAVMRWSVAGDPEFMHVVLGLIDLAVSDDPEDIAARFETAFADTNLGLASTIANAYSVATKLVSTRLASGWVQVEVGTAFSGTLSVTEAPNNCAVLVRKNTAFGGRQNRGRMYFPPFMIANTDISPTGVIDSADVTAFQATMADFYTTLVAEDLQPVLWHESGAAGTQITAFVTQSRIATQRTRMRH